MEEGIELVKKTQRESKSNSAAHAQENFNAQEKLDHLRQNVESQIKRLESEVMLQVDNKIKAYEDQVKYRNK